MKYRLKNIAKVWTAIQMGKTVFVGNESYRLTMEYANGEYQKTHWTHNNGFVLRSTCTSNWFGALLDKSELGNCYVIERFECESNDNTEEV